MTFRTKADKQAFLDNCKSKCGGNTRYEKYLGCYNDHKDDKDAPNKYGEPNKDRDLETFIGKYLTPTECFQTAREAGLNYVGLQNGNECWAGTSYGKFGKVDDPECSKRCYQTYNMKCGHILKSSVYFVGDHKDNIKPKSHDCSKTKVVSCSG